MVRCLLFADVGWLVLAETRWLDRAFVAENIACMLGLCPSLSVLRTDTTGGLLCVAYKRLYARTLSVAFGSENRHYR